VNAQPGQTRSPVLAIAVSLLAGAVLALAAVLATASDGFEPRITGSVLVAFGLGWALMAWLTTRFSGQPQRWLLVPAVVLGGIGLALAIIQPGPAAMDALSWIWPVAIGALAVWMFLRVRRELRGRGRWLVVPVILVLLLMAVGGGLTTVVSATRGNAAGPGQLVDIGGRRLHLECTGSGAPTVVLQAGLGDTAAAWARIAPVVAATTTVCAYDRAGHGSSDEAPGPQDGIAIAADLHELLARAGIPGPYVLVGHSSGGPYQRVFAGQYPDAVAGMVLVDAQPPDAFTALPTYPGIYQSLRLFYGIGPSLARLGLVGLLLGTPPEQATVAAARSVQHEIRSLPSALEQALHSGGLGDRPLVIITALADSQQGWREAHDEMLALSTNSVQRALPGASHYSVMTGDDFQTTAQAILDVVASVRGGQPLR